MRILGEGEKEEEEEKETDRTGNRRALVQYDEMAPSGRAELCRKLSGRKRKRKKRKFSGEEEEEDEEEEANLDAVVARTLCILHSWIRSRRGGGGDWENEEDEEGEEGEEGAGGNVIDGHIRYSWQGDRYSYEYSGASAGELLLMLTAGSERVRGRVVASRTWRELLLDLMMDEDGGEEEGREESEGGEGEESCSEDGGV